MVSWAALLGLFFGVGIAIASVVVWLTGGLPGSALAPSDEVLGTVVTTTQPEPMTTVPPSTTIVIETSTTTITTLPAPSTTTTHEVATTTTTIAATTTTTRPTTTTTRPTTTTTTRPTTTTTTVPPTTTTTTTPTTTTTTTPRDTTPPVVTLTTPGPASHTVFVVGQTAFLTFSCSDPGPNASGIESCHATVQGQSRANGWQIPTLLPTVNDQVVFVVGRDNAGNQTTVTRTYSVVLAG